MYNITTRIGGNDGPLVAVDAVTVTVRIDAKRNSASVAPRSFEKDATTYEVRRPDAGSPVVVRVDESTIGRRVLEVAGVESDPAESKLERALDCLAEAFAGYCRDYPDPDHLPEAWVDAAQDLLGPKRATAIYNEAVSWPSLSVMGAPAAFELAAQWLDFNVGLFDASAAQRLRDAAAGKRDGLPQVAIVPLPPRDKWPEGMTTESPNAEPCVQFDGWMRTPGRVRDIAAGLLAAADEADRDARKEGQDQC